MALSSIARRLTLRFSPSPSPSPSPTPRLPFPLPTPHTPLPSLDRSQILSPQFIPRTAHGLHTSLFPAPRNAAFHPCLSPAGKLAPARLPSQLVTRVKALGNSLQPSAGRSICNRARETIPERLKSTHLPLASSRHAQQSCHLTETCYRIVTVRRHLSTGEWAEKWRSSTERVKQAVFQRPKAALGNAVKDVGIANKTRTVLSEVAKPLDGVKNTASRYREAAGLQFEAFWKRNYLILVGAVGLGVCLLLWRIMFGIANMFIGFSEGMAKFGFLALAASAVAFAGLILRARFTINPDKVYRITMRKLNTSAAALEVLGPPLTGTEVRAYVMSGGGLRFKNFRPRFSGKRCFLIFPVQGSERRGLVSVEVKKKKGQYDFKLLALDAATPGADQRIYIIGDEIEYRVGGGLISELRDPIVKAMAAQKEFEDQDEKEDEEELREEEAKREEEIQKLEKEAH